MLDVPVQLFHTRKGAEELVAGTINHILPVSLGLCEVSHASPPYLILVYPVSIGIAVRTIGMDYFAV